eukprot:Rmarinus@m.29637
MSDDELGDEVQATYEGERNDKRQRHGKGLAVFSNGDTYEGDYVEGKRHGKGKYTFKNGAVYEGDYVDNVKHGHGKLTYPDGGSYEGSFVNGKRKGRGVYYYPNNDCYVGSWIDGKRSGAGTYFFLQSKTQYSGTWEDGVMVEGEWIFQDGSRYKGAFSGNKPGGGGAFQFSNGNEVRGQHVVHPETGVVLWKSGGAKDATETDEENIQTPPTVEAAIEQLKKDDESDRLVAQDIERIKAGKGLHLIIAGPPAGGKGTQCELLVEEHGMVHISTGDILRAAVKAGSELGLKAKEYLDAGKLVPDELIIGIVRSRLAQDDCMQKGWLLDGFPRTQAQAEELLKLGIEVTAFLELIIPDAVLVDRCVGRRLDPKTGKIYHVKVNPPPNEEVAARLIHRSDDTPEKIGTRLSTYHANMAGITKLFHQKLCPIYADQEKAKVYQQISLAIAHQTEGKLAPYVEFAATADIVNFSDAHRSLMRQHLAAATYCDLRDHVTLDGWTLDRAIQCGVDLPHLGIGIAAGDEDSYRMFQPIMQPVIEEYHGISLAKNIQEVDLDPENLYFEDPDPSGHFVQSTRVRTGRNIRGLSLPPNASRAERRKVESLLREALESLDGDLAGTYYPLNDMSDEERDQLIKDHFLFQKPGGGTLLAAAGAARDWPDGRGIFMNEEKNFLVWVNEEDHMRIISMQQGGDVKAVFQRFSTAVQRVEESIKANLFEYMRHPNLGFIATCPSNLGTALRASQFVKIARVSADERFKEICDLLHLQARGSAGEHTEAEGGMYDISNKHRLGYTEVQLVQTMVDGVKKLIELESKLEGDESVDDLIEAIRKAAKEKEEEEAASKPSGGEEDTPSTLKWETPNRPNAKSQFTPTDNVVRFTDAHKSLMRKHLSPEVYESLSGLVTTRGWTVDRAIQCGVDLPHLIVGVAAGDEDSYRVLAPLFRPVIMEYHKFDLSARHRVDLDASKLVWETADPDGKYIASTRVRCGRNIRGLSLPPNATRAERRKVESLARAALEGLPGELGGKYYSLGGLSEDERDQLIEDHFLFQKPGGGTLLAAAGAARDWPDARGIYHNVSKNFLVWCNEEDHLRIISMEKGGDVRAVFQRFCEAVQAVEAALKREGYDFMFDEKLGFISTCPSNLGTGLRASQFVKLANLAEHERFKEVCERLRLQARGSAGEHTEAVGGMYDISNKHRLGYTEVELVQTMVDGVKRLIELDQALEGGQAIDELIDALPPLGNPTEAAPPTPAEE